MIVISMSLGAASEVISYNYRRDEETLLGALKKASEAVFVLAIHIHRAAAAAHARIICKAPWELFKHKRCAVT
jgi:hypothetical protein